MKMKIDLSQFKLKDNDGKIATLVHPHGHEFRVAVNALHPENRKNLETLEKHEKPKLKQFAKGGKAKKDMEVEEISPPEPKNPVNYEAVPPKQPVQYEPMASGGMAGNSHKPMGRVQTMNSGAAMQGMPKYADGTDNVSSDDAPAAVDPKVAQPVTVNVDQPKPQAPQGPAKVQAPSNNVPATAAVPVVDPMAQQEARQINEQATKSSMQAQLASNPNDPYGTATTQAGLMQGINEQKTGAAQAAVGQGVVGKAQAAIGKAGADASLKIAQDQQDNFQAIKDKYDAVAKDIQTGHIDPQRYVKNMSTGDKILQITGLVLGGLGLRGPGNAITGYYNTQINRDIDAQKADLGSKQNLLSHYEAEFGNLRDAEDFMRVTHNQAISYQLNAAAAKQQGTLGAANAMKTAGELDQNSAQLMGQMAMRKTLLNQSPTAPTAGQQPSIPPENKIRALIPQGPEQDKHFKELSDMQKTVKTRDNLLQAYDKVAQLQTIRSRVGSPVQSTSQIRALTEPLTAGLSKETAGRYTESDAKAINKLWPTLSDNADTVAMKRAQLERINGEKMNFPQLKSLGINPEDMSSYKSPDQATALGPVAQNALRWARENPNTLKAQMVFKKLGTR